MLYTYRGIHYGINKGVYQCYNVVGEFFYGMVFKDWQDLHKYIDCLYYKYYGK